MPKVLDFSFKNVCSYGNKKQVVPFSDEPTLTLIVGENGAGKSTIGNAFEFSWYGRTRKRKLSGFANRINGCLETYNKFKTDDGRIVEIARGISPNYFELKVDGVPDNKAGKGKIDEYIEDQLLNFPFEVCTNTMILSVNDFKSFVKIKAEDKRKIVDRIFGLDVLNKMNELLKLDLKNANDELAKIDAVILNQQTMQQHSQAQLAELRGTMTTEAETRKAELESLINTLECEIRDNDANALVVEREASALSEEMNRKLNEVTAAVAGADNIELEQLQHVENTVTNLSAGEIAQINTELKTVLDSHDKQYGERIENIRSDANNAAAKLKHNDETHRALEDKEYALGITKITNSYNNAVDKINGMLATDKASRDDKYKEDLKAISISIEKYNTEYNTVNNKREEIRNSHIVMNANTNVLHDKIRLYEQNICPECEADMTDHFHVNRKHELQSTIDANNESMLAMNRDMDTHLTTLNEIQTKLSQISQEQVLLQNTYDSDVRTTETLYRTKKEELLSKLNELKLELLGTHNANIANIKKQYDEAYANEVESKNAQITTLQHELDLLKEQTRGEANKKIADIQTKYNNVRIEKEKSVRATKETTVKELTVKTAAINTEYSGKILEKNQSAFQLRTTSQNKTATKNLYNIELGELAEKINNNASIKSLEQVVDGISQQLVNLVADQTDWSNKIKKYKATQELLTEDGIKKRFMQQILPAMNATIKHIIDEYQYKFDFHFDDNFDAVIENMGHVISPDSLSTGEEKMIDIIVVLAVVELIMMKHPQLNIMFLDEVFASLDQINIDRTIKILRDIMKKYKLTLFAISHTMMPKEYFDRIIRVNNDGMFSDFTIE